MGVFQKIRRLPGLKPTRVFDGLSYQLEAVTDTKREAKKEKKELKSLDEGIRVRIVKAAKKRDGNWEVWMTI